MKVQNRIISTLLALVMLLGTLPVLTLGASAATTDKKVDVETLYTTTVYNTPEEKVFGTEETPSTMDLVTERGNNQLYLDRASGEIALVNKLTGEILLSNPYDIGTAKASKSIKQELLSQIVVQYLDNGETRYLNSFKDAAMLDQITVFNIKNGVRVEYTIGAEETRRLVPRRITEQSFRENLLEPMWAAVEAGAVDQFYINKYFGNLDEKNASAYYNWYSLADATSKRVEEEWIKLYPVLAELDRESGIYVLDTQTTKAADITVMESYIKNCCENYTFEMMDADHEATGYVETTKKSPVFKMALEYTLDADGLNVRLPCNGLRYDMSTYTLENLSILPYMGAGHDATEGYNFFPDGSGALFDYSQLKNFATPTMVRGKVYGLDFAYHSLTSSSQAATIYYPVYGSVSTDVFYTFSYTAPDEKGNVVPHTETVSKTVMTIEKIKTYIEDMGGTLTSEIEETKRDRGFVAVITDGDAFAELETYHAGGQSEYNSVRNYFNPKPKDSYNITGALSATGNSIQTVVSDRKYTGSITIRYTMLSDTELAEATKEALAADEDPNNDSFDYYDASWMGMAEVYRDHLLANNVLTELESTTDHIPLYIETFGAMLTQQSILTIPMDVMTPLTTFDNVYQIFTELSDEGIKNINFKLTGYANGGMFATVPAALKWEKAVGGKNGFRELIKKAEEANKDASVNLGLYPDFDFAYIQTNELFDSTVLKDDAVKTIDNRYSSFRSYDSTYQTYVSFYQLAISPSRYSKFYTKLLKNYEQYGLKSMSLASLGTALNSDFDEDDPYNREDSKDFTTQAFKDMQSAGYSLMTQGANAYTWGYVDHIINVKLDSSRYVKSSASVPFIGVVLHGYMNFAGTPMNEEGDVDYAMLRAIENGAGLYFILSYQNTSELKENAYLSQYYSVRYDIWKDDMISYYKELNGLLKDVQDKVIIGHQFLNHNPDKGIVADRVLDVDELQAEILAELKAAEEAAKKEKEDSENEKLLEVADAWKMAENAYSDLEALIQNMKLTNEELADNYKALTTLLSAIGNSANALKSAIANESPDISAIAKVFNANLSSVKTTAVNNVINLNTLKAQAEEANAIIANLENVKDIIDASDALSEDVKTLMKAEVDNYKTEAEKLVPQVTEQAEWAQNNGMTADGIIARTINMVTTAMTCDGQYALIANEFYTLTKDATFTGNDIKEEATLGSEDEEESEEETTSASSSHAVTNNQVVLVTYGNEADKSAYKSFILNYNNFAVRVTINGMVYTVPSGGYVVIYH